MVNESAYVYIDGGTQFTGTDDQKNTQLIAYFKTLSPSSPNRTVQFPARIFQQTQAWPSRAGIHMVGTGVSAGEWGTGATITSSLPSVFYQDQSNTGYSYPSSGDARDIKITGILFRLGLSTDLLPAHDIDAEGYNGANVDWLWVFDNIGIVGGRRWFWGNADAVKFLGDCHYNANGPVTPIKLGGSEVWLFGGRGSLMDSSNTQWTSAGLPFIQNEGQKNNIGGGMISARSNSYQILNVKGSLHLNGTFLDSPVGQELTGASIRVNGGSLFATDVNIRGSHGVAVNGGSGEVTLDVKFKDCSEYLTVGSGFNGRVSIAPTTAFTDASDNVVKTPVIKVASLAQVGYIPPWISIQNLSGNVLRPAA